MKFKKQDNIYRVSLTNRHQWYNKYFATGTLQTTTATATTTNSTSTTIATRTTEQSMK